MGTYNFDGGSKLNSMSAGWFVSYCWYLNVDSNHANWREVSTCDKRIAIYNCSSKYYKYWLLQILQMNEKNLNRGKINLSGNEIKLMAQKLLDIL